MKLIALILLLLPLKSLADELFTGYGLNSSSTQTFEVGFKEEFWEELYFQYEVGYWKENSSDLTKKSGLFISPSIGLELNLNRFEFRGGLGLSLISSSDSQIEGYFPKFDAQLYTGWRANTGEGIGIKAESVDGSRNFLILQVSKQW